MKKLLAKKATLITLAVIFVVFSVLFTWLLASPVSTIGTYKASSTEEITGTTIKATIKFNSSKKYTQVVKTFDKAGKEIEKTEVEVWYFVDEGKVVSLPLLAKEATNEDYKNAVKTAKESLTYENVTLTLSPNVKFGKVYYDEELSYKNTAVVVVAIILGVLDVIVLALAVLSLLYFLKDTKKSTKKKTAKAKK